MIQKWCSMSKIPNGTEPSTSEIIKALRAAKCENTMEGYCSTTECIAAKRLEEQTHTIAQLRESQQVCADEEPLTVAQLLGMIGSPVFIECERPRWFILHSVQPIGTVGRCFLLKDRTGAGHCFPVSGIHKDWTPYAFVPKQQKSMLCGYPEEHLRIVASLLAERSIGAQDLAKCVDNVRFVAKLYAEIMNKDMQERLGALQL